MNAVAAAGQLAAEGAWIRRGISLFAHHRIRYCEAGSAAKIGRMRIGTWNLEGKWSPDHLALLTRENCDVWLLTEVRSEVAMPGMRGHRTLTNSVVDFVVAAPKYFFNRNADKSLRARAKKRKA